MQPGTILANRYSIQEVIGIGGMGSVYRARDLHFPSVIKFVAVKEMINNAPDPLVRQTIVQNFEREANILATLDHPAIPKIFDFFSNDNHSYLVLEYIHGKDLEAIINESEQPVSEELAVSWGIQICEVLEYLHTHKPEPIIFRDMKPSNVMINQQNNVVLVDFGIAKVFRTGQKGTMIGTEGYSPPEQYRGEATPAADIYALGATLHHLLTHKDPRLEPPFSFSERPVRSVNPTVSIELEATLGTALKYNPQERFQTAGAMKEALLLSAKKTGILNRISIGKASSTTPQTIKPIWSFRCEDEIRGSAVFDSGMVFVGSYDNNLYALDAAKGEFLWKFPTKGGIVTKPQVKDDLVFIGSQDTSLYVISVRSGKIDWTYQTEGAIHSSPKIAEGHVFFGSDDGYFYAVNILTNQRSWKLDAGAPIRSSPTISQDLIYFGCDSGEFFAVDFSGQVKWRFRAKRPITSTPVLGQGCVYVGSHDGFVYALDARSGWVVWRFRMEKGSASSPYLSDKSILIGCADGNIYSIDASSAKEQWKFKTDHQVSGSPVVYKDAVYCGSADGNFYCLELKNGKLRWKFNTGGAITSTPIISNNIVYFGSADHMLYALIA